LFGIEAVQIRNAEFDWRHEGRVTVRATHMTTIAPRWGARNLGSAQRRDKADDFVSAFLIGAIMS
jgi:hypothetical protein